MALKGSVVTNSCEGRSVTLNWSASQSIANNDTTVSWSLVGSGPFSGWVEVGEIRITANDVQRYYRKSTVHTQCYNGTVLASGSFTVPHNTDGSGSLSISVEAGIFYYAINCSGDGDFTLNTIPRASAISSAANVTLGNACSVKWTPNSNTFKFKVKFTIGEYDSGWSSSFITPASTSAYTYAGFTIPLIVANQITDATTGVMTVSLNTYDSSGNKLGSTTTKTFTVTVPSSIKPTISAFTATRIDNTVPASWGIYVQDKSQCKLQITAAGAYGSEIKAYSIKQGSNTLFSAASGTTEIISTSGSITYTATVTDSRGRTATATVSITVYAYNLPSITSVLSQRCLQGGTLYDEGTYIKATGSISYASCNGKNTVSLNVRYKVDNGSTWSSPVPFVSGTPVVIAGDASIDHSYQVMYEISDAFTTVQMIDMLSTAFTTMDFKKGGKGVAIGKVSEYDDLFDVGMEAKFHKGLVLVDEHGTEYDVLQILKNLLN